MHKIVAAFILPTSCLLLVGCASQSQLRPLPYRFTLGTFMDERTEAERQDPRLIGQPFRPRNFVQALQTGLPASIFGSMEAKLHVQLKHYEVTRYKNSYALSIVANLQGEDIHGRPLVKETTACSQIGAEGFALADYATQVKAQKNLTALTAEGRAANMWQKLYNACVSELVTQYATALDTASLAPASGK
jgi:hypothetical protein